MARSPKNRKIPKRSRRNSRRGISRAHWTVLFFSTSLFSIIFFLISDIAEATRIANITQRSIMGINLASINMIDLPLEIPRLFSDQPSSRKLNIAETPKKKKVVKAPNMKWRSITVKKGDTVAKLFSRMKINPKELHQIVRLGDSTKTLNLITPGEELKFLLVNNALHELIYEKDETNSLHISRNDSGKFTASAVTSELDKRIAHASGVIDTSLFLAAQKAGIPGSMTMELANIFNWDIDFVLDVRTGDRFTLIYEEYYLDGEKISDGDILAAEFTNNNKIYRALSYTDPNGYSSYYTPDGKSMRKAFLRNPVDYTRISSKFGKRYHPVLNRMRNHHGVDYVAPMGTPIRTSGEGKITHIGRKGGYGNTVIIQHGGKYSTVYAHMKNFTRGLKRGSKVKQGDIIGFVGSTGLSTGPHLHYEFRIDGVHRNPLTVKLPGAKPISVVLKTDFKLNTQGYLTLLNTLSKTSVASLP